MTCLNEAELRWLKEYIELRVKALADIQEHTRKADQAALAVAKVEIDRRLETMNEFRSQLTNERKDYINRLEYESKHASLRLEFDARFNTHVADDANFHKTTEDRLRVIENWQSKITGALVLIGVLGIANFVYLALHLIPLPK